MNTNVKQNSSNFSFFNTFMPHLKIEMEKTNQQYDKIISICRDIFSKKMTDYGTAWRILRPVSLTDQIYIKGQRIREFLLECT